MRLPATRFSQSMTRFILQIRPLSMASRGNPLILQIITFLLSIIQPYYTIAHHKSQLKNPEPGRGAGSGLSADRRPRQRRRKAAGKAGSHKDDQITLESPDKTENRINYRKWLTSPKVFGIITFDIEKKKKKGKRRTPSDEKSGTGLYFRFCAYHEREFLPRREVSSHIHFPARMTGVADDTAVRDFLVYQ